MSENIKCAVEFLNAVKSEDGWVYYADETRTHYLVTDGELELLGAWLVEQDCGATAYSEWCSVTISRPVSAPKAKTTTAEMTAEQFAALTGLSLEEWGLDESTQSVTVWADGHAVALLASGSTIGDLSSGNSRARARCIAAFGAANN